MSEINYFDSHAHYDDRRFDGERQRLLAGLPGKGVTRIVNAGADLPSSKASVALAGVFSYVYAGVGVHPHEAKSLNETGMAELEALCVHPRVVAVGETGLDYYYEHSPKEVQRYWFKRQLALADKYGLSVIIHSREAAQETFDIVKDSPQRRGVVHSYSGSVPMALAYIEMGYVIGIGGVVTFDKSKRLPEVVKAVPLNKIVIETDAPYLTPAPHRGKRNDSSYLYLIAEAVALIKGVSHEEAARQTYENACRVFAIN
jgi:TatD DNase family protein